MSLNLKPVTLTLLAAHDALMYIGWTQGSYARTEGKLETGFNSNAAACFCSLGAIELSAPKNRCPVHSAVNFLAEAAGCSCIAEWNDDPARTKDEVLAAFLRAAELAEAAE